MLGQILVTKQTGPQGKVVSKVGMAIYSRLYLFVGIRKSLYFDSVHFVFGFIISYWTTILVTHEGKV